jgi:small subunit ribosomal protein S3
MGQKVHPHGLRLGIIRTWDSRWFAKKNDFKFLLIEDAKIRKVIKTRLQNAALSRIEIERKEKAVTINLYAARPGIIIGKKGAEVDNLRKDLKAMTAKEIYINIREIKNPDLDAQLIAENIAGQLERRVAFRRAMKKSLQITMGMGALGIKIMCSGRLGGAEIARRETYMEGRVPLHTLRANIEYGEATAHTTMGTCGVKVWLFREEILDRKHGYVNYHPDYKDGKDAREPREGREPRGPRGDRGQGKGREQHASA